MSISIRWRWAVVAWTMTGMALFINPAMAFDPARARLADLMYDVSYGIPNQINLGLLSRGGPTSPYYYNFGGYTLQTDVYVPLYLSFRFAHGTMGASCFSLTNYILLPATEYLGGLYKNPKGTLPWDNLAINFLLLNSRTSIWFKQPSFNYGFFAERGWQAYFYSQDQYDTFVHELGLGVVLNYKAITRLGVFHNHFFRDNTNKFFLKLDVSY